MSKKLLIDARQSDEVRVVVLNNNKLEDFDYETSHRRQLKGNIYLARVTRVEPSLQAAFVEYGNQRHGFLAFSEIHPDYYRIPVEDREKLLAEQEAQANDATASDDEADENPEAENEELDNGTVDEDARATRRKHIQISNRYKIQEVISNRQILLVQVAKEERGSKGAAMTTYLSLAGRYCVLMPNSFHGGGVSRKISNAVDRKKLKKIVNELDMPKGMAVIVRTAGSKRTKAEITRDFNYLTRQWDDIRALTMESSAPSLIHEEGNLIKRSIRDYYSTDIDEVLVEGKNAQQIAKDHMRNLMPSHVKKVKAYDDENLPLFQRYKVESMLSAMHDPQVPLKSGGYLVINQTEALVAIDVNSGRATKKRNIEETALHTNLEATEMIATQLRQRDLSGLVVIDFIDMEETRNNRAVERKLKDALRSDRARIQTGRISQFGLLELSRQRLRPSLVESVTNLCPHCNGTGRVHSVESAALQVLRAIEAEALKGKGENLHVFMNSEIAIYILNNKRDLLAGLEERFALGIRLEQDNSLISPQVRFGLDADTGPNETGRRKRDKAPKKTESYSEKSTRDDGEDDDKPRRRSKRSRRGGRRRRGREQEFEAQENQNLSESPAPPEQIDLLEQAPDAEEKPRKTAKKAAKKAKAKVKKAASEGDAPKVKEKAPAPSDARRKSASSSSAVNIVDVSDVKPSAKKKGWWN